ncbi:septum formation initiator family protein [Candidatus Peregrinibacteria bacterium]|nr:septum formation initiator family protein [Candidatus Peregrinibacteria bacterium]
MRTGSRKAQIIIIVSFLIFFYVFLSFATSVYRDYNLESHIEKFDSDVRRLETLVYSKPAEVKYLESIQYKDKYAKENLNLINPGEKVIVIPQEDPVVFARGPDTHSTPKDILSLSHPQQWWQYFFGQTLTK